jgi:hypothetical protein
MVIETAEILTGTAIVLLTGAIGTVAKHIYNRSKHPSQDKIDKDRDSLISFIDEKVDKEVCQKTQDCIEEQVKAVGERLDDMQVSMNGRFDTMEGYFRRILDQPKG